MGAEYQENIITGKDFAHAFDELVESCLYDYGHAGYTGTFAEKDQGVVIATLPPRITSDRWAEIIDQNTDAVLYSDSIYSTPEKLINDKTLPKSMRTQYWRSRIVRFIRVADEKWGPAAAVQLNDGETRKVKERAGEKGTRKKAYYIAGWCSS
jgi:hypothetical protein